MRCQLAPKMDCRSASNSSLATVGCSTMRSPHRATSSSDRPLRRLLDLRHEGLLRPLGRLAAGVELPDHVLDLALEPILRGLVLRGDLKLRKLLDPIDHLLDRHPLAQRVDDLLAALHRRFE